LFVNIVRVWIKLVLNWRNLQYLH